jgi:hypothetical protein
VMPQEVQKRLQHIDLPVEIPSVQYGAVDAASYFCHVFAMQPEDVTHLQSYRRHLT